MDYDERLHHFDRRDQLASLLSADRFKPLSPLNISPSIVYWSARNAAGVREVLTTPYAQPEGTRRLLILQENFVFHFRNFAGSLIGARDYLFAWSKDSHVPAIDAIALAFKKAPAVLVVNELRSRMLHGALVFGSFGWTHSLGGPRRGMSEFHVRLVEGAIIALRKLPGDVRALVSDIERSIDEQRDWMSPLVAHTQGLLEDSVRQATETFRKHYRDLVSEWEGIRLQILLHERELERLGVVFETPRPSTGKAKR